MGQKTTARKAAKLTFDGSRGIDTRANHGKAPCPVAIDNFRILPDGSLQKRNGYKKIFSSKGIRTIWSGIVKGKFECFVLVREKLYKLDTETGETTDFGSVNTTSGKAQIFYFRDQLYLIDGSAVYQINEDEIIGAQGYVPLFGKDWSTGVPGEINEPLNLINPNARITYLAEDIPTPYLPTLYAAEYVQAVYKNGVLISDDEYRNEPQNKWIFVRDMSPGDSFEVNLTYNRDELPDNSDLLSCRSAESFGGINTRRLFLWNGNVQNTIFFSATVDKESLEASIKRYGDSGPLYFRTGDQFVAGDGRYSVTAISRHYDRLLIFTEGDTWMADSSAWDVEEFPVMNINNSVGCYSHNGVVTVEDGPISVSREGIFKWTADTDELNESNAYCISDPITPHLSDDFLRYCVVFYDRRRKEIWFHEEERTGVIWIYNLQHKAWTSFSNIFAAQFFDSGSDVGFVDYNSVYVFSDEEYIDSFDSGTENITATIQSGTYDFVDPSYKKMDSFVCRCDPDSSELILSISTDRGEAISTFLRDSKKHAVIQRKITTHRMRAIEFKIVENGAHRPTIHSIEIYAR